MLLASTELTTERMNAPRGCSLTDLPVDELALIVSHAGEDVRFLLALTCRALRDATRQGQAPDEGEKGRGGRGGEPTFHTSGFALCTSVRMLEWALSAGWMPPPGRVCAYAAERGQLDIVRYACDHLSVDASACAWAAAAGQLEVLEELRARDAPRDTSAFSAAACVGDERLMIWLHANGFPVSLGVAASLAQENGVMHEFNRAAYIITSKETPIVP